MVKLLGRGRRDGFAARNGLRDEMQRTPVEDWRTKERLKDCYNGGSKYSVTRMGPIRRFLRANVGRPWDEVHSEFCRDRRDRGRSRSRLLAEADGYVQRHVILVDGVPCHGSGHAIGRPIENRSGWYFYVCPESGLLMPAPDRPRTKKQSWMYRASTEGPPDR